MPKARGKKSTGQKAKKKDARIVFVEDALYSLNFCAVRARDHLRQWFWIAFNQWYVQSRHPAPFATFFDYGLQIVEAGAVFAHLPEPETMETARFRRYRDHLHSLQEDPLMQRARQIWKAACRSDRPGAQAEVGGLLISALVGGLVPGCPTPRKFEKAHSATSGSTAPDWSDEDREHIAECPRCAKIEADILAGRASNAIQPQKTTHGYANLRVQPAGSDQIEVVVGRFPRGKRSLGKVNLEIEGFNSEKPYPTFWLPSSEKAGDTINRVRLFMAHIACQLPVTNLLDESVVDACMRGPNKKVDEYQPPRLYNNVLEERTKSRLPGSIAGLTRVEIKTDTDSLLDVVPSELALMLHNETAGLQKLLEKPLIHKREREQDEVPKHRALVCFLTEAADISRGITESQNRDQYHVFARRQAFDVIRDMREAWEKLPNRTQVEIDVAMFVMRAYRADAVVHRLFRLDALTPRRLPEEHLDRFDQMLSFSSLVPGYFNRVENQTTPPAVAPVPGAYEIIDPQVERFLQQHPQRVSPYHAEFVVAIGSVPRLMEFVPAAIRDVSPAANVRRRVMLIAVDPDGTCPNPSLGEEPPWGAVQARSLYEAAQQLNLAMPQLELGELRSQLLEAVFGDPKSSRKHRRLIQLVK